VEAYCASRASVAARLLNYNVNIVSKDCLGRVPLAGTPGKSELGTGRLGGAKSDTNEGFVWCGM
jgi:hypothetical protein